jgi:proline iminopeptidase/L-proline amide hydrolase
MVTETTGTMDFCGYKTWYRIVGEPNPAKAPLLTIHGGPGNTHYYLRSLDEVAERFGRQVIYYDQISCGNSPTPPMPDKWSAELFEEELAALREHLGLDPVHILGQSWGGMLLMQYATHHPEGVSSMIVASSPASSDLWLEEAVRLRSYLPKEMEEALAQADIDGDYDRPEVVAASAEYYRRHVSAVPEAERPDNVRKPFEDPVGTMVYNTMQGKSEFVMTGKLSHWDVTDDLPGVTIPTLVTSGVADEATPKISKIIYDAIPDCEWELFDGTHCCHLEHPHEYAERIERFMSAHDPK